MEDGNSSREKSMIKSLKSVIGKGLIGHLVKQLNSSRIKKPELMKLYRNVFGQEASLKKFQIAEKITHWLIKEVSLYMDNELAFDDNKARIKEKILQFVQGQMASYGMSMFVDGVRSLLNRVLKAYLFPLATHHPPNVNPFLVKYKYDQMIPNIWGQNQAPIKCLCPQSTDDNRKVEQCYRCGQFFHADCFWSLEHDVSFECPFCFMKFCLPNRPVKKVLFAGYLPALRKEKTEYKVQFPFSGEEKFMKNMIFQARCVKFNIKDRYELSWPDCCSLFMGKTKIQDIKPLLNNSPLKRRHDDPIRIEKFKINSQNEFIIEEKIVNQQNYRIGRKSPHLIMIVVAEEVSQTDLIKRMSERVVGIEKCKQSLKQYLEYGSKQLMIEKIAVSLRCQFYGSKIKMPIRSAQCKTHYQPFDLANYICSSIQAKNSAKRWKCPICNHRAYDVFVDEYILDLMKKNQNAMEISFRGDAEPEIYEQIEEQESVPEEEPKKLNEVLDVIDLDSEESFQQKPYSSLKSIERKEILEIESSSLEIEGREECSNPIVDRHPEQSINEEQQEENNNQSQGENRMRRMRQQMRKVFFFQEQNLRKRRKLNVDAGEQEEVVQPFRNLNVSPEKSDISVSKYVEQQQVKVFDPVHEHHRVQKEKEAAEQILTEQKKKIDLFGISDEEDRSDNEGRKKLQREENKGSTQRLQENEKMKSQVLKEPIIIEILSDEEPEFQKSEQEWLLRKHQQLRRQHKDLHKLGGKLEYNDIDYFYSIISKIFNDSL